MLNLVIGAITLAYPFLVYFGLSELPLSAFALLLMVLFGTRLVLSRNSAAAAWSLPVSAIMLVFAAVLLLQHSADLLLYYPVLVNLCMLLVFAFSLIKGPPIIERLARLTEPQLPPQGVRYTRTVTWVWCFFFASTVPSPSTQR